MSGRAAAEEKRRQRRAEAIHGGWQLVRTHTVLAPIAEWVRISGAEAAAGPDHWGTVDGNGVLRLNRDRDGEAAEWAWAIAHLLLHLGLDHLSADRLAEAQTLDETGRVDPVYAAACCVAVTRFADVLRIGRAPFLPIELPGTDELTLTRLWRDTGVPPACADLGTGGHAPCLNHAAPTSPPPYRRPPARWSEPFAVGLTNAATRAIAEAAGADVVSPRRRAVWDRALSWFVSSFPLLGAVAAGLTLVVDAQLCRSWEIAIAAVNPEYGEVYLNPHAGLTEEQWRFALAHEMLHAALRHDRRAQGRDPYLWNVACDYVINGWLLAMAVGIAPEGILHDQQLAGLSAESVYDTLTTDLRRARKLRTLGAREAGDVLGDWLSEPDALARRSSRRDRRLPLPWVERDRAGHVDLDDFYRRALSQGLEYHRANGRGTVPYGLEEEIRALDHPPLPWDARLARWFDEHVRAPEPRRSYARAARRQSATPDIPRPGKLRPDELTHRRTFGVVLDTSGSMDRELLGKALGAIGSYAMARDVPAARVVFCDAIAYDAGYLAPTEIAGRVTVRGRGGTILQPGVNLLERAEDFPDDGPILIITDGACDVVRIRREHAFLVPPAVRLPFTPRGPVFRVT